MSFLAPLFLLGGLLIAGPILFHLIRRTTKDVVPFSSLMFLSATPPRMTKRSRLENLWLLLLRMLAILLLALAFGRPLLQRMTSAPPSRDAGRRTVVLLDTSASMRRENLWPRALEKLRETLERLRDEEGVAVLSFDRAAKTIVSFDDWAKGTPATRVESTLHPLAGAQPSWLPTALGAALLHASELLNAAPESSRFAREIVVISDLQEGSRLEGLQGYEWPHGTEVLLEPIQPAKLENARADWIASATAQATEPTPEAKAPAAPPLRIRVTNEAGSAREQFQLRWAAGGAAIPADVPGGQSRIVAVPPPTAAAGDRLLLSGDETGFDNETFVVPPRPEQTFLLFLGNDAEADSQKLLYFLRRAFPATQREKFDILTRPGGEALPVWELMQAQLLILGEGVTEAAMASARSFAEAGKIVLFPLTSEGSAAALGHLLGVPALSAERAALRDYAMLAQIDFQHPLFAPFADPRYSDFSKIHFWGYRKLDAAVLPGARVLASFDTGDPAILQVPVGQGSVVVLTSSWRPTDSQLALSTKFVPLLQSLLGQSSRQPTRPEQYFVADPVPMRAGTQPWIVTKPGGAKVEVAPNASFTATDEPGLYGINPGAQAFAVNLAAEESRTNPLPLDRLTALGVPIRGPGGRPAVDLAKAERAKRAEDEARQKLWRWLIAAAVVLLLGETLLASRTDHRPQTA